MSGRVFAASLLLAVFLLPRAASAAAREQTLIEVISDNSFLIEEAYNQEPGVIQHIFNAVCTQRMRLPSRYFIGPGVARS